MSNAVEKGCWLHNITLSKSVSETGESEWHQDGLLGEHVTGHCELVPSALWPDGNGVPQQVPLSMKTRGNESGP